MSNITIEDKLTPVRQFNCTSCGASLEVFNKRAKYTGCSYCGSLLDVQSDTHKLLSKLGTPTDFKPYTFVRLGMQAQFNDKKYQVIGRTRWRMDYKERWEEEGEVGYSTEIWYYDEWLMLSEQRTYFYLVEDKEGFYVSNEIYPTSPSLPRQHSEKISFYQGYKKKPIQEIGAAKVQFFEGESNYRILIGDRIGFANYKYNKKKKYAVEWRINKKTANIKEIEYFEEIKKSNFSILEAFEENEAVKKILDNQRYWRFILFSAIATLALFFITTIVSINKTGEYIFVHTYDVSSTQKDIDVSITTPRFNITKPGLYQLKLRGAFNQDNTSMYSIAYIHNEKGEPIRAIEGDFYYWTGIEDGERWTESNKDKHKAVLIKEAGTYYAELYVTSEYNQTGQLTFEIRKNILLTRYFLIGTILLTIFSCFAYSRSQRL